MSVLKAVYMMLYLVVAMPVFGYIRYLHDEAENSSGAMVVFLIVVAAGIGVLKMNG